VVEQLEAAITLGVHWLKLGVDIIGAVVIGVGCVVTVLALVRNRRTHAPTFTGIRLLLARYLALGLEFQLAADVLVTAVAPSWDEIGKLAAIATIRTVLNVFLAREIQQGRAEEREEQTLVPGARRANAGQAVTAEPRSL
jgi:uncharacterized membrane protein